MHVCPLKSAMCFVQRDLLVQLALQGKILDKGRQLAAPTHLLDDFPNSLKIFVVVSNSVWTNVYGAVDHCAVKDWYVGNISRSASRV